MMIKPRGFVDGKIDLHLHTTYSDGALSPSELVKRAKSRGLSVISITDHDSVGGLEEAIEAGKHSGVRVIPGIELSASYNDTEVHMLGYFVDYQNRELVGSLTGFQSERLDRAKRILGKLNMLNVPLNINSVLENVTGDSVGRQHIAIALVNGGHAESYFEAFDKYIGNGRPAYEQKLNFTPEETIRLIAKAGGLSFLAHPGKSMNEKIIFKLIKAGLDGIEVLHPSHTPDLVCYYRGIVDEYFLLESGGSDFHGGNMGDDDVLGKFCIHKSTLEAIQKRLFSN